MFFPLFFLKHTPFRLYAGHLLQGLAVHGRIGGDATAIDAVHGAGPRVAAQAMPVVATYAGRPNATSKPQKLSPWDRGVKNGV